MTAGPLAARAEAPCPPQPLRTPLEGAGFSSGEWPLGEVIRFSAAPSFERVAYAVQIARSPEAGGRGEMHVVKLVRQRACNRYSMETEWRFPLSAGEMAQILGGVRALEANWREEDTIMMDGTVFSFEHRRHGEFASLRLWPAGYRRTERLSALILGFARSFAGEGLPEAPDWSGKETLIEP